MDDKLIRLARKVKTLEDELSKITQIKDLEGLLFVNTDITNKYKKAINETVNIYKDYISNTEKELTNSIQTIKKEHREKTVADTKQIQLLETKIAQIKEDIQKVCTSIDKSIEDIQKDILKDIKDKNTQILNEIGKKDKELKEVKTKNASLVKDLKALKDLVNKLELQKGDDGKSAYDIACELGFKGTKEEWIKSLHGKDGQDIELRGLRGFSDVKKDDKIYARKNKKWVEIENPDLSDYVKKTDYANSSKGGVIKTASSYNTAISNGALYAQANDYETYQNKGNGAIIGKGTLENVITGKQLVNETELDVLREENARLKATLPTTTGTGENITLDKTAELEFIQPPLPRGNSEQAILPTGYTQLDYIESTGTQHIDTGITADNTVEFDVTFNTSNNLTNAGNYGCIFGSRQASVTNELQVTTYSDSGFQGTFRYGTGGNYNAYLTRLQKINVKLENNKYYVDGEEKFSLDKVFSSNYNIYIFTLNQANTAVQHGTLKLYKFKLWKNGSLVRSFVPCKNASDEVGLYDLVSETFFGNSGSGTFIAGDVSTETLPNPNIEVPIQNVTGDVEVLVQNKNQWKNISNQTISGKQTINNDYIEIWQLANYEKELKFENNEIIAKPGENTGSYYIWYFKLKGLKPNTQYTITGKADISGVTASTGINILGKYFSSLANETGKEISITYTTDENGNVDKVSDAQQRIMSFPVNQANLTVRVYDIMLQEGSTASTYTPHKEQTFTFPLGTQRMYLGDYLANDGIHHVRKQVVFNGTENWSKEIGNDGRYNLLVDDAVLGSATNNPIICNNFQSRFGLTNYSIFLSGAHPMISIVYQDIEFDLDTWKAWLAENPITVEYELATEEVTPYTTEQQTTYDEIKQALSYEEQTNISGTSNEANPIFSVEAYQSIKLVLAG